MNASDGLDEDIRIPYKTKEEMYSIFQMAQVSNCSEIIKVHCKDPCARGVLKQSAIDTGDFLQSPLILAVDQGSLEYLDTCLSLGADPNLMIQQKELLGSVPILIWTLAKLEISAKQSKENIIKKTELLLRRGADPNRCVTSPIGDTAPAFLFASCHLRSTEIRKKVLDLLVKHGTDPNCRVIGGKNKHELIIRK